MSCPRAKANPSRCCETGVQVRKADGRIVPFVRYSIRTNIRKRRSCCSRGCGDGLIEGARRAAPRVPASRRLESRGGGSDVRRTRVWARLLGLQRVVVEDVYCGDEGEVVVAVRPIWRERDRCGECRRRSPGFDLGDGRRRWRALDLGSTLAFLEADAPRVRCRRHGIVVCAVPWASGPGTRRGSPARLRIRRRGWRSTPPRARSPS